MSSSPHILSLSTQNRYHTSWSVLLAKAQTLGIYTGFPRPIQCFGENVSFLYVNDLLFLDRHRCLELHERESEELMAIFLKYNGPDGIRKRYSEELKGMKTRISDADDGILFEHMENFRADPTSRPGEEIFDYGARGKIYYRLQQEVEDDSESDVTARPSPAINLVPFGGGLDGVPHHHNMNPADDHSLNATLLDVLHRLMNDENGKPFIKEAEGKDLEQYLSIVERPRYLKFIEKGLRSDKSIGYGATAFFNDMRLLFVNNRVCQHRPGNRECAINLEVLMKKLLGGMGDVGEQLLVPTRLSRPGSILGLHADTYFRLNTTQLLAKASSHGPILSWST